MENFNQPQASFLITRMLDEMVALIVSVWEIRDRGVNGLDMRYEGEDPIDKVAYIDKHFDPYKHLKIEEFMVNIGSYLSEMLRVFTLDGVGEFAILMDYLEENVEKIHYMGSVINRIEQKKKLNIYQQ